MASKADFKSKEWHRKIRRGNINPEISNQKNDTRKLDARTLTQKFQNKKMTPKIPRKD
jgi:hypothetical protein